MWRWLLGIVAVASFGACGDEPAPEAASEPSRVAVREPARALIRTVSEAGVETVRPVSAPAVFARPGGRRVDRLSARTPYGTGTRLWVRARRGGWLKVAALNAPGGVGWVDERRTRPAPRLRRRIEIDLSSRRLSVVGAGRRWSTPVVVGAPASPTPLGTFQVTDRMRGERFHGVYGGWILVLSAYGSPSRTSRLAVHGVPPEARSLTGSAGCVRVPARALRRLAREIPPGTPVRIRS
jgi:lipoprotein-anchoring transpeptidase ErfK/SrfK